MPLSSNQVIDRFLLRPLSTWLVPLFYGDTNLQQYWHPLLLLSISSPISITLALFSTMAVEFLNGVSVLSKAKSFSSATRIVAETYQILKSIIRKKYGKNATNVGDEGG